MRARKVKAAYECPHCGTVAKGPPESVTLWLCEDIDENGLTTTEPEQVDGFQLECGCLVLKDELELTEGWICGECGQIYLEKEEAKECCR